MAFPLICSSRFEIKPASLSGSVYFNNRTIVSDLRAAAKRSPIPWRRRWCELFDRPVAALPLSEFLDRGQKVLFREIRPKLRRDVHFRVGKLPKKKVRQSHLARRADEQVRIRIITRVKMFAEHL